LPAAVQDALRQRAIRAVLGGMTHADAARLVGVARGTVTRWMARYRSEGEGGLAGKVRGRPSAPKWRREEAATIVRLICHGCPDDLGLSHPLWTREAVTLLINEWLGLDLSSWTVRRHLQHWGLIPPAPVRRAPARDREALSEWWQAEYPAICRQARAARAELHWGRVTRLRLARDVNVPAGGEPDPVAAAEDERGGLPGRMISAVTNRGTWRFRVFAGPVTADLFLDFLGRLTRSTVKKAYLIVAPDPVHSAEEVARWLARHEDEVRTFVMPASPP